MGAASEPRSANLRGFTIIEVMIVVAMLTFGLLSLSAMQIHAMKGGNQGRHATRAAALAESEMEFLQYASWTSGAIDPTTGWTAPEPRQTDVQVDGGTGTEQDYSLSYRITDLEPTFTRAIDIEVSWVEPGGKVRSIILSSIRFNREGI
jgi:prepilin-type N-terminal cleavage/methylation domain-containing protein